MPKSRAAGGRLETSRPPMLDCPRCLRIETGDRAQQRGLAAAGRAEEADELAGHHIQRDVIQRRECAEFLDEVAHAQIGRGRSHALSMLLGSVCCHSRSHEG